MISEDEDDILEVRGEEIMGVLAALKCASDSHSGEEKECYRHLWETLIKRVEFRGGRLRR